MDDFDDFSTLLSELCQIFNKSGHEKFMEVEELVDDIYLQRSINARYIEFCNNKSYRNKKKISISLMKFDIRNGLTWTTCFLQSLRKLPDNQSLKVFVINIISIYLF